METCLYAEDLDQAEQFYQSILGLELVMKSEGRHLFFRCGQGMLMLFQPETTLENEWKMGGNIVPSHGATGPGHVAFSVDQSQIPAWRDWLKQNRVEIESEVDWPAGARSIYFRDPANNSLELASPVIWKLDEG